MGLIKTGIQAGVAYAAVNKVANAVEANAKAKGSNKVPPHAPCNCPHCPYSAQAVYGNNNAHGSRDAANYAYGASPYAPAQSGANASYYAAQAGAPVPRDTDRVLERGAYGADDKKAYE